RRIRRGPIEASQIGSTRLFLRVLHGEFAVAPLKRPDPCAGRSPRPRPPRRIRRGPIEAHPRCAALPSPRLVLHGEFAVAPLKLAPREPHPVSVGTSSTANSPWRTASRS